MTAAQLCDALKAAGHKTLRFTKYCNGYNQWTSLLVDADDHEIANRDHGPGPDNWNIPPIQHQVYIPSLPMDLKTLDVDVSSHEFIFNLGLMDN